MSTITSNDTVMFRNPYFGFHFPSDVGKHCSVRKCSIKDVPLEEFYTLFLLRKGIRINY